MPHLRRNTLSTDLQQRQLQESNPIGPAIWFALSSVKIINFVLISLRVYVQKYVARSFGKDDWFAVIGWIFLNANLVVCAAGLQYIRNTDELSYDQFVDRDMSLFAQSILYDPAYLFLKVSMLFQYLRLLHPSSKRDSMWYNCWVLTALVSLFYTIYIFLEIFQCNPVEASFMPVSGANIKCLNSDWMRIASSSFNSATDIFGRTATAKDLEATNADEPKVESITCLLCRSYVCLIRKRPVQVATNRRLSAVTASIAKLVVNVNTEPVTNGAAYATIVVGVTSYLEMTAILICSCSPYTMAVFRRRKTAANGATESPTLVRSNVSHRITTGSDAPSRIIGTEAMPTGDAWPSKDEEYAQRSGVG